MKHKVFLSWLIYIVIVILITSGLLYLGIPQIAILSDHSYLVIVLLGMYIIAEIISGFQAWKISKEQIIVSELEEWLDKNEIFLIFNNENNTELRSETSEYRIPVSATRDHIISLQQMSKNSTVDQTILLEVLDANLNTRISTIEFIAGRIVWVGILATILGVILAFWPLLGAGMAVEAIRLKLGSFFAGIAVAFIPTAASFIFKIALDFGSKILNDGTNEIVTKIAKISATKILPKLYLSRK